MGAIDNQFMPDDIRKWKQRHMLQATNDIHIHGSITPNSCITDVRNCLEASLDCQYIYSANSKADTWFWSIPNNPFFSPFWRLVADLNADSNAPDVHSISYANSERYMNPVEARKFNEEACKLALRGITLIAASGDTGAHGIEGCYPPPPAIPFKDNCTIAPLFPASCPYITAVGATMIRSCDNREGEVVETEIAATVDGGLAITSGGGFSNIFERPAWQNKAVKAYLSTHNNVDENNFNVNGRAYPDVSLLGSRYEIMVNGEPYLVSGSSASAPVFASLISLANSMRLANNKPKLGFLNPLLYNKLLAPFFEDIVEGNNRCCMSSQWCCEDGFDASEGWDPVTGLGTLNWKKFLSFIKDYPNHHRTSD
jgi:tripeptidyl-peptidase-1